MLSVDFYNGQVYAAGRFADGRIYHYFNGVRITDWFDGRARARIEVTAGSLGGTNATASIDVTGGTLNPGDNLRLLRVNNVDLFDTPVAHTGNNATTAQNVVNAINGGDSTYTATLTGTATVTITAPSFGISYNGFQITSAVDGAFTVGNINHMSGGIDNAVTDITVDGVSIIGSQVTWETSHSTLLLK